jgi:phosphatidate cytidylyltransferase
MALATAVAAVFAVGGVGVLVATVARGKRLRESVLARRYATWLGLAVVYSLAVALGPVGVAALAAALAAQAAREAAPLLRLEGPHRVALVALCAGAPPLLLGVGAGWFVGVVFAASLAVPLLRGRADDLDSSARLTFGALLVGWPLSQLVPLSRVGEEWVVFALFGTGVSDVCAFTIGSLVGGPKLAPRLSPGKTWAGLGGNLLGAALALALVAPLLPRLDPAGVAALVCIVGAGGCVGDLSESLLKRHAGVKDAGAWLPGFGGLLDRVDSLLVVAPALLGWLTVTGLAP